MFLLYSIAAINFVGKTQQIQTTDKIADSFPGMDGYVQAPVPQKNLEPVSVDLTKPPKWLKRPVGASFGVSLVKEMYRKIVTIWLEEDMYVHRHWQLMFFKYFAFDPFQLYKNDKKKHSLKSSISCSTFKSHYKKYTEYQNNYLT